MTPDGCTRVIRCAKGRGVRAAYHRFLSSQAADLRSAKRGLPEWLPEALQPAG